MVKKRRIRTHNKKSKFGWIPLTGLSCVCVRGVTPYFFLFCDVDTLDIEVLRQALKFFSKNGLSCYWYETLKGYHIVSPCLLNVSQWKNKVYSIKGIIDNYYEYITIRWNSKPYFFDCNLHFIDNRKYTLDSTFDESMELHKAIAKRFKRRAQKRGVKTHLQFVSYEEYLIE